jgi:type 1 glutamine amidotransferase
LLACRGSLEPRQASFIGSAMQAEEGRLMWTVQFAQRTVTKRIIAVLVNFLLLAGWLGFHPSEVHGDEPRSLLLLGQGPDGHPEGTHEYVLGLNILEQMFERIPQVRVRQVRADEPWNEGPDQLRDVDGIVLFLAEGARWLRESPERLAAFQEAADRDVGLVCLHWAMGTKEAAPIEDFVNLFGACHGGPDRRYQVLETRVTPASEHEVVRGFEPFTIHDEFYYQLKRTNDPGLEPLLHAAIDGQNEMVSWAWERPGGGRSFGFSGLHFHENWSDPSYRRLIMRGTLWTLRIPLDTVDNQP